MMDIKFRAWLPSWEEMDYSHEKTDVEWSWCGDHFVLEIYHDDGYCGGMQEFEDVEIMQSTEMRDKNGKDIYIGDIIFDPYSNKHYEIIKDKYICYAKGFYNSSQDNPSDIFSENYHELCEVVGNIYENKELLND